MSRKDSKVRVEEKGDKEKMREMREESIYFPFILWVVILFPQERVHSKNEESFQN